MKYAVITGATKGIGKELLDKFAKEGFSIAFCARNEQEVFRVKSELATQYPNQLFIGEVVDVSNQMELFQFANTIKLQFPQIDILLNNAGVFLPGSLMEEETGVFEKQINTNVASAYHITRALISLIEKARGYIFNICSTASFTPYTNGGSYCISKFAMLGFSKVLREELKSKGVRVTSVMPGATLTNSWTGTDLPKERFMQPEDIAQTVYHIFTLPTTTVVEEIILRPLLGDIGN